MGGKPKVVQSGAASQLLQLHISLCEIDPPIWRRVLVPSQLELGNLHHVIQIVMDWEDCHLHEFVVGERMFSEPHPENSPEVEDEWQVDLAQLLPRRKAKLRYWYDFGDEWWHEVVLERYRDRAREGSEFRVLDGARAAPPEDSGGPHAYLRKLEVLRDPGKYSREEAEEILEWLGEDFDPEYFEVVAADRLLQSSFDREWR